MNHLKHVWQRMAKSVAVGTHALAYMIGIGLMMNANAQPKYDQYDLIPVAEYFKNPKSIALLQAALRGDLAKAKELVADGADPNEDGPDKTSVTRIRLLHYAIASNNLPAVKILLTVGADPELKEGNTRNAMTFTVNYGDVQSLALLLDWRPIKTLSQKTVKYMVFDSVRLGRRDCLDLLLQRGVPIDYRNGAESTILMDSMSAGDFDLTLHLLDLGAAVDVKTPSYATPARQVQWHLTRYKPGSETYRKLERIKQIMVERGLTFPVPTAEELRERARADKAKASGG